MKRQAVGAPPLHIATNLNHFDYIVYFTNCLFSLIRAIAAISIRTHDSHYHKKHAGHNKPLPIFLFILPKKSTFTHICKANFTSLQR